ncbi:MAG: T9SS type A sorting domain-containing protein, partial [Bacteroidia bacterium]
LDQYVNSTIRLFPNPAKDRVRLDFGRNVKDLHIEVYAASGQLLAQRNGMNLSELEIDLPWPAGMYVARIWADGGLPQSMKFLKD